MILLKYVYNIRRIA